MPTTVANGGIRSAMLLVLPVVLRARCRTVVPIRQDDPGAADVQAQPALPAESGAR